MSRVTSHAVAKSAEMSPATSQAVARSAGMSRVACVSPPTVDVGFEARCEPLGEAESRSKVVCVPLSRQRGNHLGASVGPMGAAGGATGVGSPAAFAWWCVIT